MEARILAAFPLRIARLIILAKKEPTFLFIYKTPALLSAVPDPNPFKNSPEKKPRQHVHIATNTC